MFSVRLKKYISNNRLIKHIEIGKDEKSKKRRFFIGEIRDWPQTTRNRHGEHRWRNIQQCLSFDVDRAIDFCSYDVASSHIAAVELETLNNGGKAFERDRQENIPAREVPWDLNKRFDFIPEFEIHPHGLNCVKSLSNDES